MVSFIFICVLTALSFEKLVNCEARCDLIGSELVNSYPFFGTKTTYSNAFDGKKAIGQMPKGLEPVMFYAFIRHGIRYPDRDDIEEMKTLIDELTYDMSDDSCTSLKSWKLPMIPDDDNRLSLSGAKELAAMASRYRNRFPKLLKPDVVDIVISKKDRTRESAAAFYGQLVNETKSSKPFEPTIDSLITSYHDECETILGPNGFDQTKKKAAVKEFEESDRMRKVLSDVSRRLGLRSELSAKQVKMLYKICSFSIAIEGSSPFCSLFAKSDLATIEYLNDLDDYFGDAYGASSMVKVSSACSVVHDFWNKVQSLKSKSNNVKGHSYLRFSHAGAMKPLIAFLEIAKDKKPLESLSENNDRRWRSSLLSPFAANVAFVVLKDKDDDLYIMTLLQEIPVSVKGCHDEEKKDLPMCKLKKFTKKLGKEAEKCDLAKLCRI